MPTVELSPSETFAVVLLVVAAIAGFFAALAWLADYIEEHLW